MKILIAEDEPHSAHMLSMLLGLQGHVVHVALTGQAALALAADEQPDLAVIDLRLPDMDGTEIIRAIHGAPDPWPCVSIALTNYDEPGARANATAAGVNHFMLKSEDVSKMLAMVDTLEQQISAR